MSQPQQNAQEHTQNSETDQDIFIQDSVSSFDVSMGAPVSRTRFLVTYYGRATQTF